MKRKLDKIMMRGGVVTALDGKKEASFGYNYLEFHETNYLKNPNSAVLLSYLDRCSVNDSLLVF